jgi:transposase InsO family protein
MLVGLLPFYGVLRMTERLRRQGHEVNEKWVRRLLRKMGLMALYPKPNLSKLAPGHKVYPYLLGILVERLWRTVKYEDIYLKRYKAGMEALQGLGEYFRFYNADRPHESLQMRTPEEVYTATRPIGRGNQQGEPSARSKCGYVHTRDVGHDRPGARRYAARDPAAPAA